MKKLLVLVGLLLILVTGCSKKEGIVGTWYYYKDGSTRTDVAYIFNEDKTGSYNFAGLENKFTYEINENVVKLVYTETSMPNEFEYEIKDNILIIKDSNGLDVTYKRK